jgi:hypothetical protein
MAKPEDIRRVIKELNPSAIFINGFDDALYGTGRAIGGHIVAIYIADECLRLLIEEHDMDEQDAWEHFNRIVVEGKQNPYKPIFISDWRNADDIEHAIDEIKIEKQGKLDEILDEMEKEVFEDDEDSPYNESPGDEDLDSL